MLRSNDVRRPLLRLFMVFVCQLLAANAGVAAGPVAVFEAREVLGRDWPRTLVNYTVTFKPGVAKPEMLRLVAAAGAEQPCQIGRIQRHPDGSIASARVSFMAALSKHGRYSYRLLPEKPAASGAGTPRCTPEGEYLTLDNQRIAVRLPRPLKKGKTSLRWGYDHVAMVAASGKQEEKGIAPGPLQGIRLGDGRWTGGSYFWSSDPEHSPRIVSYDSEIVEQGPLFAEARVHYDFDNGGYYDFIVRLLADDPAARIDEQLDLKQTGPGFTWRVILSLSRGWERDGWKPYGIFWVAPHGPAPKDPALEQALQKATGVPEPKHGGTTGCRLLPYDATYTSILNVDVWYPFAPAAHYFGVFDKDALTPNRTQGGFLAIVPLHAGSWRGNPWGFQNSTLYTHKADDVEMQWPLMADPHPNTLLHTGEYDPAQPLTFKRRLWALIGGPFQYHGTLFAFRQNEGNVGLDQYKDWILDWPEDKSVTYPRLVINRADAERARPRLRDLPGGDQLLNRLYLQDNPLRRDQLFRQVTLQDNQWAAPVGQATLYFDRHELFPWFSHYRQSQMAGWCHDVDELFSSPGLEPARRKLLREHVAAMCYLLSEPDFNPRGSLVHLGNPNMPINRFFALTFAAALIPDHPRAAEWLDVSEKYARYKLAMNIAPGGAWSELLTYLMASMHVVQASLVLDRCGRLSPATAELATLPGRFALELVTPHDPRFGARALPNWGHEGCDLGSVWLVTAALARERDPELARAMIWAWDQLGRPIWDQHDVGFRHTAIVHADLLDKVPKGYLPPHHKSVWLPGFGAVLRAHAGDPQETYLSYRQGYLASHSDANQGDFVLYSKGAALSTLSLFNYAIHGGSPFANLHKSLGWHNRVRFGSPSNDGGWPGGGQMSQVHAHSFGDSADYLRGLGDYDNERWTRQIMLLKGKTAASPNYFVFRDSFHLLDPAKAPVPKWWTLRTPGAKGQLAVTPDELRYTSSYGPKLDAHFLQPAKVAATSQDANQEGVIMGQSAANWRRVNKLPGDPVSGLTLRETMTVTSVGPIGPAEDVLVVLYPRAAAESPPKYQRLADGVARIDTSEGTDYVFIGRKPLAFRQGDIEFEGIAGAVRIRDDVHLIIAEGPGRIGYRGTVLSSPLPVTRVLRNQELRKPQTIEVPAPPTSLAFVLDPALGAIEKVSPGVRRQKRASGFALEFKSDTPLDFSQDNIVFRGKRGGIVVDATAGTTRLVLLDGEKLSAGVAQASGAAGPYDLTFHPDRVTGQAEGLGRFLYISRPARLDRLPVYILNGQTYAPGTSGGTLILPLLPGKCQFEIKALEQPPIFAAKQGL